LCQVRQVTGFSQPGTEAARQNVKKCTEFMSQRFTTIPGPVRNALVVPPWSWTDLIPEPFGRPLVSRNRESYIRGTGSTVGGQKSKRQRLYLGYAQKRLAACQTPTNPNRNSGLLPFFFHRGHVLLLAINIEIYVVRERKDGLTGQSPNSRVLLMVY